MAQPKQGKKEQRQADALTAHVGTEWEKLLTFRKAAPQGPAMATSGSVAAQADSPSGGLKGLESAPKAPSVHPAAAAPWKLARQDWEKRIQQGQSLLPDLPLHKEQADRAVAVFNKLKLADVTGTPSNETAAGEWFREIVRALFGAYDPAAKKRAIDEVFVLVPKKNSKSTYGALLMLTALLLNERPKAKFFFVAPVHDTAEIAFSAAAGAIQLDTVLEKKLHIREHIKTIVHRVTGATLQIMTFDPTTLTGQKVAGVLIDELHVVSRNSKAGSSIRQLRGGMLPFPDAFMVFITTQSDEAPAGVFKDELIKAREIRDGLRHSATLPVMYEFPKAMQEDGESWRDPKNWWMVSPNAGRSITVEDLVAKFDVAQATSEEELRSWASQHLNVEIGLALHSDRWVGAVFWERQGRKGIDLKAILERCEVITVGIDGGGMDDLLALTVVGREVETRNWLAWTHAWANPKVLELRKSEAQRLRDFAAVGDLTIVQETKDDIEELASIVASIHKAGLLHKIGVDPQGIGSVLDALEAAGIRKDMLVAVTQGWQLTGSIKTTERKLAEGGLLHGSQPILNWAVGNAKVEPKGNAIVITKHASGKGKIDPLMALFDAVQLMAVHPPALKGRYKIMFV